MGNDTRKNNIQQNKESMRKTKGSINEKLDFLSAITKLITDWSKAFPNDTGSIKLLNKLYKRIDFDGVSLSSKKQFDDFLNKYHQKIK